MALVGIGIAAAGYPDGGRQRDDHGTRLLVGGSLIGGGLALTATGWTLFGLNGAPSVKLAQMASR